MNGRIRHFAGSVAAVIVMTGMAIVDTSAQAATLPKPTHTNKTRFRIPFKFDAAALQRMNAREIQLHVSRDHGATWDIAQALTPEGGRFEYQSPSEGEYWFSVKTLDGRNHLHPPSGSYETGLIVVVDQTPPAMFLSMQQSPNGVIQLNWRASDVNLDANTLKLEFRAPGSNDWEALRVPARSTGEHSWTVNQSGMVHVRGTIGDLAGNVGHGQAESQINASGDAPERPRPTRRPPIANSTSPEESLSATRRPPAVEIPINRHEPSEDHIGPIINPQGGLARYEPSTDRLVSRTRTDNTPERWTGGKSDSVQISNASLGSPATPITPPPAIPSNPQPTTARSTEFERPIPAQRSNAPFRIVPNCHFQIAYKLDEVGPSGVGGVELFITEDNGRQWWKYDDDPDQRSPFDVKVRHDGLYGFAIRVRSGAGLSNDPPLPNEPPAIVIAVDQTPPSVELFPIQQGHGVNINRLQIRWKITDDYPAEKPVALYYAANLNGPWEPISNWKEDVNGSFEWTVGPGVPPQFYVRVAARDAAGNMSKAETPTPIVVDLMRPTARIVDVEVPTASGPQ
ncbi:hypothetical protein [Schlesneria paludicola]|uniref:hypothetical protein n=1 Tax=Schlesneria paludicola TaxID=360056 RepID=UPI000299DA79|nr:hypothetical protein [Schlesneria paludicola]